MLRLPIVFLLCCGLIAGAGKLLAATLPTGNYTNFQRERDFRTAVFSDVKVSDWFYDDVKTVYEYGLMVGDSATTFWPNGNVTVAEAITLAARLHSIFYTGRNDFKPSNPWYQTYVDYAKTNNMICAEDQDYNRSATRAECAVILSAAFPDEALAEINQIPDDSIPDVRSDTVYWEAVYRLYRAGVLEGNDEKGTFAPDSNIMRCEVAGIVARFANPNRRIQKEADPEESEPGTDTPQTEPTLSASPEPGGEVTAPPATAKPAFVIETVNGKQGEKNVAVTVLVKNNPGLASIAMLVSYDDALTLKAIEYNDAIGGENMLPQTMQNPVKLIWVSPFENVTGDWTFATLFFDVAENASVGKHQIAITYDPDDVFDLRMINVSFETMHGAINITK